MTFSFDCAGCSHSNKVEWLLIGKAILCGGCGRTVVVPAPMELSSDDERPSMSLKSTDRLHFRCLNCNRRYASRPDMIGKKIRCGGCGVGVRVPEPGTVAVPAAVGVTSTAAASAAAATSGRRPALTVVESVRPAADLSFDSGLTVDPPEIPDERRRRKRRDGEEEIEEVALPSRSQRMDELEVELAEKAAIKEERAKRKAKRLRKAEINGRHVGGGLMMSDVVNILGATSAGVVVLGFLCYSFEPLRFLIGGFAVILGFAVHLMGSAGFSKVAEEEGGHHGLMCRFCPGYKWYYLLTRWDDMKEHFVFVLAGLLLFWPGMFIVKNSPEFRDGQDRNAAIFKKSLPPPVAGQPVPPPVLPPQK